jgi:elongator complex protein 1
MNVAYEFLGDYQAAVSAYRSVNLWREALSCAGLSSMPEPQIHELASSLADGLEEAKEYQSAATVYLDYLEDVENGARLLCRAYQFADAIRIVIRRKKLNLLNDFIDPGLVEGFNTTSELIADCKSQIGAQLPRLKELRIKKEQEPCK